MLSVSLSFVLRPCSSSKTIGRFAVKCFERFLSVSAPCPSCSVHNTHTHTQSSRSSKQLGRSDSDREAPCIYLYNYHCLFLSVSSSLSVPLCLFSSPSFQPTLLPSFLSSCLQSGRVRFVPTLSFYPCCRSLAFLSTLHSFILSRFHQ